MSLLELHNKIAAISPIDGVDGNGKISFRPEATEAQKTAAQDLVDAWVNTPEPNWEGLLDEGLPNNPTLYVAILASSMAAGITGRISRLASGSDFLGASDSLIILWNADAPAFDQAQRETLTALASTYNIPLSISDEDNTLSYVDPSAG